MHILPVGFSVLMLGLVLNLRQQLQERCIEMTLQRLDLMDDDEQQTSCSLVNLAILRDVNAAVEKHAWPSCKPLLNSEVVAS